MGAWTMTSLRSTFGVCCRTPFATAKFSAFANALNRNRPMFSQQVQVDYSYRSGPSQSSEQQSSFLSITNVPAIQSLPSCNVFSTLYPLVAAGAPVVPPKHLSSTPTSEFCLDTLKPDQQHEQLCDSVLRKRKKKMTKHKWKKRRKRDRVENRRLGK